MKYQWLLRKKCILSHQLPILRAPSSALSSVNTVFMPNKKKKKEKLSGVSSNPETLVTRVSCLILLFWPQNVTFLENMTSDTARRNASLVSKCLLRCQCHSSVFQYGQEGSVLEVPEEKILCPEKIVSVVLKKGGFMTGDSPACPPQWKGRGGLGQACVCAAPTPTPC